MNELTKTQKIILVAATMREDGSIYPMPDHIKGGATKKVLASLHAKELITNDDKIALHTLMALDPDFKSTRGQYLNHIETERQAKEDAEIVAAQQGMVWDWQVQVNEPPAATTLDTNSDLGANVATAEQAIAKAPRIRDNTKKAKVIEMLKRPEGATAAQIAAATGWQGHTVRGFLSIAKKKLGLVITTSRMRIVGPNQQGSPGSMTTYFAQ